MPRTQQPLKLEIKNKQKFAILELLIIFMFDF